MNGFFLHLSIADWVNSALETFVAQYGDSCHHFSVLVLRYLLVPLEGALRVAPPWLVLLVVGAIYYLIAVRGRAVEVEADAVTGEGIIG